MNEKLYRVTFNYEGITKTEKAWAFSGHDAVVAIARAYWCDPFYFDVLSVEDAYGITEDKEGIC